jgi:hypothetical protein
MGRYRGTVDAGPWKAMWVCAGVEAAWGVLVRHH